jgi:hypothetical protein
LGGAAGKDLPQGEYDRGEDEYVKNVLHQPKSGVVYAAAFRAGTIVAFLRVFMVRDGAEKCVAILVEGRKGAFEGVCEGDLVEFCLEHLKNTSFTQF